MGHFDSLRYVVNVKSVTQKFRILNLDNAHSKEKRQKY